MNRLILADNQAIFRAGAARVLALEDDIRIVAQCEDAAKLRIAIEAFQGATVLFSSSIEGDIAALLNQAKGCNGRPIMIIENSEEVADEVSARLHGVVCRSIGGPELVDCIRRVGRGQRYVHRANVTTLPSSDTVGTRVRDRLTPKEMQIVALIVQGCKNKDIAAQLGTKEQVIKNYLRGIYDKTGVSDRLELALFTIHHQVLAEAAAKAGELIQMRSA